MIRMFADEIEQRCIDENHEIVARAMSGPDLENGKELERLWVALADELKFTDNGGIAMFNIFLHDTLRIDPNREDLKLNNSYWRKVFLDRCFNHGLTKAIEMTCEAQGSIGQNKVTPCAINMIQDTPEVAYAEVQYQDAGDDNKDDFCPWIARGFTE